MMKEKLEQNETSLQLLDWYINVFENGDDTRDISKKLQILTKQHDQLQSKFTKYKAETDYKVA